MSEVSPEVKSVQEEYLLDLVGNREELEAITGKKLPEALFGFVPCGARVLVTRCPADDTTEGGIVIPEQSRDDEGLGWVLADMMRAGTIPKGGLACYPTFVHYDIRGIASRWRKAPKRPRGIA